MKTGFLPAIVGLLLLALGTPLARAQRPDQGSDTAPIYRVTVIQRTAEAISYEYRSGPTKIDFRGTVLLPRAKGEATVESRKGRTEIDAKLDGLTAPQRYGGEYLTYVLWAITPEGRPHNIAELIPGPSDNARVHVTTDLQAFALIVTAEPYSAVRQPSDVVVLENQVRPDTLGVVHPVVAKYELLPRGGYTWRLSGEVDRVLANTPKVSMHEYEAVTELYQAQNAVGIARAANAARYAPDTLARAEQMLAQAQRLHDSKDDFRDVVRSARTAAQTAEDARLISLRRQQEEQLHAADSTLSKTQAELRSARQAKDEALEQARNAQSDANAAQEREQAALAARAQAEANAAEARERASEAESAARATKAEQDQRQSGVAQQKQSRVRLFEELGAILPTLDTPRGLVVTVPDDGFHGAEATRASSMQVARLASILSSHRDLYISVEGSSNSTGQAGLSRERAYAVRQLLIANGVAAGAVSAEGVGTSRPLSSNATAQGRKENSRVEIIVAGNSIGQMPLWERSYSLSRSAPSSGPGITEARKTGR